MSLDPDHEGGFSRTAQQTLTGPVVVTRNPCLHPGDVRLLTAVYAPQLAHLVDCVVFPNHGPRPHPSEMAGITYTHSDGDNFLKFFFMYLYSALFLTYLKKKRQRQPKKWEITKLVHNIFRLSQIKALIKHPDFIMVTLLTRSVSISPNNFILIIVIIAIMLKK